MNETRTATSTRPLTVIREFLRLESAGGILLMCAAAVALLVANSPASGLYERLLATPLTVTLGGWGVDKPVLLWINDGLMAIFFLLVGLEVKREVLVGQLSSWRGVALPLTGAIGGLVVPAIFYVMLNRGDEVAMQGWAIPMATDIAFALGVLGLLGDRVPQSLKLLLLAIAIIDDLAAITIIALFYSGNLSTSSAALAGAALVVLVVLNRRGVRSRAAYVLVGVALWLFVLKSGVHATLAGVALAFTIPLERDGEEGSGMLVELEHDLHPWVAFAVLPVFAFANAGVSLGGLSPAQLLEPVPLGIVAGLFLGKQIGVFGFSALAVLLGIAEKPRRASWLQVYGVSVLCGIGFTMSLFIASLAFERAPEHPLLTDRLGILVGSLLAALVGYSVLRLAPSRESS